MSCQVKYVKFGKECLSPIFGDPKVADGYAKTVGGTVIPSAVVAPKIEIQHVADPKVVDRERARVVRTARKEQLASIEYNAKKLAKERGLSEAKIIEAGKRAVESFLAEEKAEKQGKCIMPNCDNIVYGGFSTCRACGKV